MPPITTISTYQTTEAQFDPSPIRVRFMANKAVLWQVTAEIFSFPLSVRFHQCSIFIFMYMLLLEGRTGEAWKSPDNRCCFRNLAELDRKTLTLSQFTEQSVWLVRCSDRCHSPLPGYTVARFVPFLIASTGFFIDLNLPVTLGPYTNVNAK
jgi:hypothetical protein